MLCCFFSYQIKTDVQDSALELKNLQSSLNHGRTLLSVIYQLLSIDCALETVKTLSKQSKFLEASLYLSKIPVSISLDMKEDFICAAIFGNFLTVKKLGFLALVINILGTTKVVLE